MHSCIYEGTVRHRRFLEKPHSFRNKLFLMYLDLDELPDVFNGRWFWSVKRPALARFRREHYLGDANKPLQDCVRERVEQDAGFLPAGPVRLLTNLSYFGYLINPVSFYYCFDADSPSIEAIVAEVTNTPWGERHCYVIDTRPAIGSTATPSIQAEHDKEFHVSPFMPMNMRYHWKIRPPGDRVSVHVENRLQAERAFDATLELSRREINGFNLARALVRYPFMTARIAGSIYWQAVRLWLKKVTFYPHPDKPAAAESMTANFADLGPR